MAKKENKFVKVTRQEEIANVNFGLGRPFDFEDRFNRIAFMGPPPYAPRFLPLGKSVGSTEQQ